MATGIQGSPEMYHSQQKVDKFRTVDNEAVTLSVNDQVITALSDSDAFTITLPQVAEAQGKTYSIFAPNGNTNTVTIAHGGDSAPWTNVALDGANDSALLFSDGRMWHVLT